MKTHTIRLALLTAVLATLSAAPVFGHADGHLPKLPAAGPSVSSVTLPATLAETLAAIKNQHAALKTALEEGKFSAVSANAVTLNQLVQHIVGQVPADHKASVKEIADKHATATAELTRAAAAGATKPVSDLVSKLGGNIRALQIFAH